MTKHRTQNVTKIENLKCNKTQKLKMCQNSKTQNVKKKTQKLKCDKIKKNKTVTKTIKSKWGKNQKLKM